MRYLLRTSAAAEPDGTGRSSAAEGEEISKIPVFLADTKSTGSKTGMTMGGGRKNGAETGIADLGVSAKAEDETDGQKRSSAAEREDEFEYRRADIVAGGDCAEQLIERFAEYEGEVYYPCAGGDKYSLFGLINMFPKASRFVFNDGFYQQETAFRIPNSGDLPGIIDFLREDFSFIDSYYELEICPIDIRSLRLALRIRSEAMKQLLNRDSMEILYKIGDYEDEEDSYGVIYVQQPGLAGHFSKHENFWEKIASQLNDRGIVLTSRGNTFQPPSYLLRNVATVMVNQDFEHWVPLGTKWDIYDKTRRSSAAEGEVISEIPVFLAGSKNDSSETGMTMGGGVFRGGDLVAYIRRHAEMLLSIRAEDIERREFTMRVDKRRIGEKTEEFKMLNGWWKALRDRFPGATFNDIILNGSEKNGLIKIICEKDGKRVGEGAVISKGLDALPILAIPDIALAAFASCNIPDLTGVEWSADYAWLLRMINDLYYSITSIDYLTEDEITSYTQDTIDKIRSIPMPIKRIDYDEEMDPDKFIEALRAV